jgi:hypothetical protein
VIFGSTKTVKPLSNKRASQMMMKTILTVAARYDPQRTDPEGLAVALDRLLETALSTPGIMNEYANPTFGEFFVADSKPKRKSAPRVVLDISGGVLQEAFCNDRRTKLIKVDWDTDGSDPTDAGIVEITDQNGRCRFVSVVEYPALPPARLAGTDVLAAMSAAGFAGKGCRP